MAETAFGTLLRRGDGGTPETFTTIAEVEDISGPDMSVDMVDVTTQTSPGGWKQKLPTLLDGGSVTFSVNLLNSDATHNQSTGLQADMKNRTQRNYRLVFPDASYYGFAAFVNKFKPDAKVKDALKASIALDITGAVIQS